ncbi:MAG TPA: electron transfer flavoprotein subunit alpha/FixB family protein [Nitrososphaerales archaeon]|nr:electron transfer flavoprotein subunit alpha/FixB family protein [Nitrososphaerales archaeon]
MSQSVWVYSEIEGVSDEVASAALDLSTAASAAPSVIDIGQVRSGTHSPGDKLVFKGPPSSEPEPQVAAEAIFRAAKELRPAAILIGATRNGREVASRLAAKMQVGCLSEAFKVSCDGQNMFAERNAYAGKVVAKVACPLPAVATVKVGAYPRSESTPKETRELDVGQIVGQVKVLSREKRGAGSVDLKSAKIIVSAGRGIKKKEDLAMLEELASEMHGALGCSRPLSSDLGWLPEEHHIGLTGVTVKPDLYLAVGISGQLQHVAGMKDSKIVAAINTDKDAPIFQASDFGIVGDLYQVVPAIRKALASRG